MTSEQRILVVDDNFDAAELLKILLEHHGFDVRTAYDGAEALTIASDFHPHITCSDLDMPIMSGFDLASALRKTDFSHNTYLIAMTGLNTEENYHSATRAGFDTCYMKPFSVDDLIDDVRSYFFKIQQP